jgi:hypothetical protein
VRVRGALLPALAAELSRRLTGRRHPGQAGASDAFPLAWGVRDSVDCGRLRRRRRRDLTFE